MGQQSIEKLRERIRVTREEMGFEKRPEFCCDPELNLHLIKFGFLSGSKTLVDRQLKTY